MKRFSIYYLCLNLCFRFYFPDKRVILNYANELPKQSIMQICEAGSSVNPWCCSLLQREHCCSSSAWIPSSPELFNYHTPVSGPGEWGSPSAHPQCPVDLGGWRSCVCCIVHLTVLPTTSSTQIWSGCLRRDKCCFIWVVSRIFEVTVMGEILNCFSNVSTAVTL